MTSIKENILEEVIRAVKKMNGAGEKVSSEPMTSNRDTEAKEEKETMINTPFTPQ